MLTQLTHFSEELTHLEPAKMKEAGFSEAECRDIVTKLVEHAKNNGDPFIVVPYMRRYDATSILRSF